MNQNAETLETFEPYLGLVVFGNRHKNKNYLQVHDISKKGNAFTWGEGKPFQREQLAQMGEALRTEQITSLKLKGLLPEEILFFQPSVSGSRFMWFIPAQKHYITFTSEVGIKTGTYKFPALLMAVINNTMYIFAIKTNKKPDLKTELFHAPFFNVYNDGKVCMGTVTEARRKAFLDEELDRWQRRFFGGKFTTAHGEDDRIAKNWTFKKAYAKARVCYPAAALHPSSFKTVGDFVRKLQAEGRVYE